MTAYVFLDTGVTVDVPPGVDPDTDEGYDQIKALAAEKFLLLLQHSAEYEIEWPIDAQKDEPEVHDGGQEAGATGPG